MFNLVEEDVEGELLNLRAFGRGGTTTQTRALNLDLSQADTAGTRRASLERKRTIKPFRCVCDDDVSNESVGCVSSSFKEAVCTFLMRQKPASLTAQLLEPHGSRRQLASLLLDFLF